MSQRSSQIKREFEKTKTLCSSVMLIPAFKEKAFNRAAGSFDRNFYLFLNSTTVKFSAFF